MTVTCAVGAAVHLRATSQQLLQCSLLFVSPFFTPFKFNSKRHAAPQMDRNFFFVCPTPTEEGRKGRKERREVKKKITGLLHPEDLRLVPPLKNHAAGFFLLLLLIEPQTQINPTLLDTILNCELSVWELKRKVDLAEFFFFFFFFFS
jgi:hypothetical protein